LLLWVTPASVHATASPPSAKPSDFGATSAGQVRSRSAPVSSAEAITSVIANAPVCAALYDQSALVAVPDGGGGAIAVWTDFRGADLDIYAQKVNAAGVPQWTTDGVPVCKSSGAQTSPQALADGAGGVFVVWEDARAGASNLNIYAQRINALGVPLWGNGGVVVCGAANHQRKPVLSSNGLGGLLIAWVDERGADPDVYAQRLNSSGAPQWAADGVALCTATGVQEDVAVVSDASGGAIAVWRDDRSGVDLYAQRVNESGVTQWTANGNVVCAEAGDQTQPSAFRDGVGGMIVAWTDARGAHRDIYVQRISNAGALLWPAPGGVLVGGASGHQDRPRVSSDGNQGAVVVWEDRRGADADVYAQKVNESGASQWLADGEAVCAIAGDQVAPVIASDPMGGSIVAWSDTRTPAAEADVYIQHVQSNGSSLWTLNGVRLCDASGVQDQPVVIADGGGGAVVAWRDFRGGYSDIYGQRVDALGQIPDQCVPPDTLSNDIVQNTVAVQNYRTFLQGWFYWSGVGVQGSGGDWDLECFDQGGSGLGTYPTCFGFPLAGSYGTHGADIVMANFNDNHTPPGRYGVRAYRYSGSGGAVLEWDSGNNQITLGSPVSRVGWPGVLEVYDVPLTAGNTYTFDLTHSPASDIKVLLFSSYGSPGYYYVVPRSARVMETAGRYGIYTAPSTEYYGVAIVNDNGVAGDFTLNVVQGIPTGVGDSAPGVTGLKSIAPNPGRGPVSIHFALAEPARASFQVFDMAGRQVASIAERAWQSGAWSVPWDGRDAGGRRLGSGVYFVQMNVNGKRVGFGRLALLH
jgi:hypothetical protein